MSDYISREAVLALTHEIHIPEVGYRHRCIDPQDIRELPAADVRPVVLCRDCKWCHAGYCEKFDDIIPWGVADRPWEDWFCADGEKKEES